MRLRTNKNIGVSMFTLMSSGLKLCRFLFIMLGFMAMMVIAPKTIVNLTFASNPDSKDVFTASSSTNEQSPAVITNILRVGPGQAYLRVQDAAAAAQDGDIIEISAGTYTGNNAVAVWNASNLIIRGVGNGRAHLEANGAYVLGKGIFVAAGNNITIENIEFSGAVVPDHNGAGIRLDGSGLTIRNCYFHDNEDGILTADGSQSDVVIEYSEFWRNGLGVGCETTGCTHNMYINHVRSFTLRGSYTHGAQRGHEVKSRALKNLILYNRISDEQDGTASYGVDLPNGGDCYLIGNVIEKGANSENPSAAITFALEGASNPIQQLRLVNNTIVDDKGISSFVRIQGTPGAAIFINNIFTGSAPITAYSGAVLTNNLTGQDALFVNRAGYDYHLQPNSPAIDAGVAPGSANGVDLTPVLQYLHPSGTETRTLSGAAWDIGAFERQSANVAHIKFCDFDGDGKTDISVFRPGSATWYLQKSQAGFAGIPFGLSTDKLVPGDYDGDGTTDIAVFRQGSWYSLNSSNNQFRSVQFGQTGDILVPGDYDGDGKTDVAVFRQGSWYVLQSSNNQLRAVQFGIASDKPVPADFDGDGKTDVAVYRNGSWYSLNNSNGDFRAVQFGTASDIPVVGDYDGDGRADQAVYRNGVWYLNQSSNGFFAQQFGLPNDIPVAADYDGDGRADIAVFRQGNWYLNRSSQGFAAAQFGINGDLPIPAAFVP